MVGDGPKPGPGLYMEVRFVLAGLEGTTELLLLTLIDLATGLAGLYIDDVPKGFPPL